MDIIDLLPVLMFGALGILLFSGYPVAFVLGGVALGFAALGIAYDVFVPLQLFNLLPRIWGGIAENLILTAIPMFSQELVLPPAVDAFRRYVAWSRFP